VAFRGRYEHSLDSKDRITVPARFRAALDEGVVLLQSLDPCVAVYPVAAYTRFSERFLAGLNPLSRDGRMMVRRFNASAHDERLDSAGRVRLPRHLIEHAGLSGGCVVIGVDDHLEIWNRDRWAEQEAEIESQAVALAEQLAASRAGAD
jgi:MraZ protein